MPHGPHWAHEIKHDGYRMLCRRDADRVRVFSRHGREWTDKVPAIVAALLALPASSVTLDGEAVMCDDRGVSDFEALRTALAHRGGSPAVFLYAFDLLSLDGRDLRRDPWQVAALRPVTAEQVGRDRIALAMSRADALLEKE